MKRLKKRKKQKPETVKVGHITVKIYPHRKRIAGQKRPYLNWQVADYTTGERKWRTFADHAAAIREAERIAGLLSAGDVTAATMKNADAASWGRAVELIRPTGDALEVAAARYAEVV